MAILQKSCAWEQGSNGVSQGLNFVAKQAAHVAHRHASFDLGVSTTESVILLQEAEAAERSQPAMTATCIACVKAVIDLGIEEEDRKRTWMADADEAIKRGSVETARAIYGHALSVFPGKKSIWRRAAQLEKAKGSKESLDAILKRAVTYCPQVHCPI